MTTELGHTPTKQEIAYRLGVPVSKLTSIIKSAQSTISMETPASSSEDSSKIADFIVDEDSIAPDSRVSQENLFEDIRKMLNQLSPKERDVLILRYGLDNNGNKKTLDEIGSQYGVSRERIRQIENRAIAKLKKLCKNKKLSVGLKNYFGEYQKIIKKDRTWRFGLFIYANLLFCIFVDVFYTQCNSVFLRRKFLD
ncbi:MAG: sigma-70 family RNA polymerase sigma factor [Candidatus Gastranaerophilaceae bacterium]